MPLIVGDAETFYDGRRTTPREQRYSLRIQSTEEYILDRRFECHGWAISIDGDKSNWLTHNEAVRFFASIDWQKTIFAAHNCMFDAAILVWRYGHMPKAFIDTLGIANRFIRPHTGSSSLDACAKYLSLPLKTNVIKQVDGLRTQEIVLTGLWRELTEYACQDNDNCLHIVKEFYPLMSDVEQLRLHWSVANYVRGRLRIDVPFLQDTLNKLETDREALLAEAGIDKATARSRAKFAEYLETLGVIVDYKNGKNDAEIPALAKKDHFVQQLLLYGSDQAKAAMRARLAFASTLEVTRAERLLRMGRATGGRMLMPTYYHAAHTGRPGGTDKVNILNFTRGSDIRKAIKAPPGKMLVSVDASQIEARYCAWVAGCDALLDAFADPSRDVYCEYASQAFNRKITKKDERERQVGKVIVLSCQYGVGWEKTLKELQAQSIDIADHDARHFVNTYRRTYPEILRNGEDFMRTWIDAILTGEELELKGFVLSSEGMRLPSGRMMLYSNLTAENNRLLHWSHRYKSWQNLFPGAINENICQSLVNDHIGEVQAKYVDLCVGMIYDSLVLLIDEDNVDQVGAQVVEDMIIPPWWCSNVSSVPLPLKAEVKISSCW